MTVVGRKKKSLNGVQLTLKKARVLFFLEWQRWCRN